LRFDLAIAVTVLPRTLITAINLDGEADTNNTKNLARPPSEAAGRFICG
jgi:hypothetical protein